MKQFRIQLAGSVLMTIILLLTQQTVQGQDNISSGTVQADQFNLSYVIEGEGKPAIVIGSYDYLVAPASTWNPIRSKFHDLTIRVFEKSGHTPQYEQAVLFDKELLEWLELKKE